LITGANSGIGKATAVLLAREGARVVMVCRKRSKGEYARVEIEKRSGADSLELLIADLASFQSVRQLAEEFTGKHDRLHVLINNAGLFRVRGSVTVDGFETTLQVNYLSHFLLTNLLLGLLKKSAPSRIVNVSSVAHYGGRIDFDELQNRKAQAGMKAYSQSKLAQVLFTYELSRRLQGTGVTANCLHPGGVATNIWGNPLGPARFLAKVARLFLVSPEKGAETPVYLASSPDVEGVSGQYYEGKRPKQSSAESYDVAIAQQLWRTSSELTGLIS
jgi:NAD(P)-dependent dehydrogenase (short-subunit alcohol dehydrogenase family)